jgi:hypothetical protein
MATKTQIDLGKTLSFQYRSSAFVSWRSGTYALAGSARTCVSESHRAPYATSGDNGGPLLITTGENTWTTGTQQNSRYNGPFTVGSPVNPGDYQENSAAAAQSDAQLDQAGTTAIARCEPTNPIFDAATFIGELRDGGIPKAPGLQAIASLRERTAVAKAAGSEYLNVEFGWKPLVSDLRNLSRAVHESHQIMSSYRKGSGKKIRRAFSFPPENSTRQYKGAMLPIPSQVNAFLTG